MLNKLLMCAMDVRMALGNKVVAEERERRAINVLKWMLIKIGTVRWELLGCARKIWQPLGKEPLVSKKLSTLTETSSSLQRILLNGQWKTLHRRKAK